MNGIVRAMLERELKNANDDLLRAELQMKNDKEKGLGCSEIFTYISGKKAQIRAILESIEEN